MEPTQVRRVLLYVLAALAAGVVGGYLAALLRPHPATAWASDYLAPHPDAVALSAGTAPAAAQAPVDGRAPGQDARRGTVT